MTEVQIEKVDSGAERNEWCRAYLDAPDYRDGNGRRIPKLLGGGSRAHCERLIREYRKKNFKATQWPAKIVEVTDPGKDPAVSFE